jgi:predicted phosphodiesterase
MKLLVFSDSHLSARFDEAQYNYLYWIISHADKVVINGDFWDRDLCTFNQFVNSEWKRLFPLLLSKDTTYIYGNHDYAGYCDGRVNLFSKHQAEAVDMEVDGRKLHIEHGNKIALIHQKAKESKLHSIIMSDLDLGTRIISDRIFKTLFGHYNEEMARWAEANLPKDTTLICGHIHIPANERIHQFINTGFNKYGYGQYLLLDDGVFKLMNVRYGSKWKYLFKQNKDLFSSNHLNGISENWRGQHEAT